MVKKGIVNYDQVIDVSFCCVISFFFLHLPHLINVIWTIRHSVSLYFHALGSTTDTDKELSAGGDEMGNLLQTINEEDAVTENYHAEATESSDNDDEDDHDGIENDKENSDDRHNETDAVIIENDLKIHEL